jgi:ABC-type phosphate/phosphonate transport system substrate-binding protein
MVSLMADNAAPFYRALTGYLAWRTGIRIEIEEGVPWQERERMFDRGEVEIAVICGLPYVQKADRGEPLELLAAPVMAAERYGRRPVYFSDVIVRRDSPYRRFADLRGASWAYNEPNSHSGYNLTRYHLARLGERNGYFSRIVEGGAHQMSLRMVLDGRVDASAIDAIVLEMELKQYPELAPQFRVLETFGPSPIPPAVVSTRVPLPVRQALRETLLSMHEDAPGREILSASMTHRFVPVTDADYDDIRQMTRVAAPVRWTPRCPYPTALPV